MGNSKRGERWRQTQSSHISHDVFEPLSHVHVHTSPSPSPSLGRSKIIILISPLSFTPSLPHSLAHSLTPSLPPFLPHSLSPPVRAWKLKSSCFFWPGTYCSITLRCTKLGPNLSLTPFQSLRNLRSDCVRLVLVLTNVLVLVLCMLEFVMCECALNVKCIDVNSLLYEDIFNLNGIY